MRSLSRTIPVAALGACALAAALAAGAAEPQPRAGAPALGAPVVVRDAKTGRMRPATAQEVQAMAAEVDRLLARGKPAGAAVELPDGSTAYRLTGNFTMGAMARRGADGKLELSCFDEPEPAKRFLGLAPQAPPPARAAEEK